MFSYNQFKHLVCIPLKVSLEKKKTYIYVDVGFSFCLILFFKMNCVLFSLKQNIFSQ